MPRSASTWSYNVCRLILDATAKNYIANFFGEQKELDKCLQKLLSREQDILVKAHFLGNFALDLVKSNKAKNVYTYRDPRDAISSSLQFIDKPFEKVLEQIAVSLKLYDIYNSSGNSLFISYDDIIQSSRLEINKVAHYLNIQLDPELASQIDQQTNLAASRKVIQSLPVSERQTDSQTLLHSKHIQRVSSGYWKEILTPAQKLVVNSLFQPWLLKLGYETEASLYRSLLELFSATPWEDLADEYLERSKYYVAQSLYERAIELFPEVRAYSWQLGKLLLLQGEYELAESIWFSGMADSDLEEIQSCMAEIARILATEADRQKRLGNLEQVEILSACLASLQDN
jgi:tetratricopeptide (TPR) repeat protein